MYTLQAILMNLPLFIALFFIMTVPPAIVGIWLFGKGE